MVFFWYRLNLAVVGNMNIYTCVPLYDLARLDLAADADPSEFHLFPHITSICHLDGRGVWYPFKEKYERCDKKLENREDHGQKQWVMI